MPTKAQPEIKQRIAPATVNRAFSGMEKTLSHEKLNVQMSDPDTDCSGDRFVFDGECAHQNAA